MANYVIPKAAIVSALVVGSVAQAKPAQNALNKIELDRAEGRRQVVIRTEAEPVYSVFRLTDPFRVLVDVNHATVKDGLSYLDFSGDELVRYVSTHTFKDERSELVRVEIGLTGEVDYDVVPEGNSIVVRLSQSEVAGPTSDPLSLGELSASVSGDDVVVSAPIAAGSSSAAGISIQHVADPSRMVIDITGATATPKWQTVKVGDKGIDKVRVGASDTGVRVVMDLDEGASLPQVDVDDANGRLEIRATFAAEAKAEPRARSAAVQKKSSDGLAVSDVRFEEKAGFLRLSVKLSGDAVVHKDSSSTRTRPVLRVKGANLPESLVRTLDTSAIGEDVVEAISSFNSGEDILLVANVDTSAEHRHWQREGTLFWDFRSRTMAKRGEADYAKEGTAGYQTMAEDLGNLTTGRRKYRGRRISLDLKDADIKNILRLLADVSKLNIVAADDVSGKVTLKLRNVPWDQALDIILQSKSLDKVRVGNIIRVAPIEVLEREEQLRLARKEALEKLEVLSVRLIPVNYADAQDIQQQVQALLSQRGRVNVDKRTNVIIVEDIQEVLIKVERMIRTLDTQTPQVLIEARIVEAATNFARSLGLQWGGTFTMAPQFGNETGLTFPNTIRIQGGSDGGGTPTQGVLDANNGFAVNLPGGGGPASGGAIGFVFGSAGGSALVSLRLSASESQGRSRIISAPKVVTLDNTKASIASGERIPITVVTANGPTTRFVDANLQLDVTPHVTSEGSIHMKIDARKNEISGRTDALGVPGIITRQANTELLVRDGDTAVLGGIYRRTATESQNFVPWIGRVPVLGWLFKNTINQDSREELLIFVSPRIVNRDEALIAAQ